MEDAFVVDVLKPERNFVCESHLGRPVEQQVLPTATFRVDGTGETTFLGKIHDEVDATALLVCFVELNDVAVAKLSEDGNLFLDGLLVQICLAVEECLGGDWPASPASLVD